MLYKGLQVDDSLYDYIKHIKNLEKYRSELQQLQIVWDNLTLLGRLSKLTIDMSDARNAFQELTSYLLNHLSNETVKKTCMELKFKAQVTIDMMVRNLFERTADIGFFATDDDIRRYVTSLSHSPDGDHDELTSHLLTRFQEYTAKYSVYHNIILLDTHGNVLLQLDQNNPVTISHDPLIAESLTTEQAYVETFRYSDLEPKQTSSLIYSYRVLDEENTNVLAVVCLCFRFENECTGIFSNLLSGSDHHLMTLLNDEGRVIASSNVGILPLNTKLQLTQQGEMQTTRYQGREYLACSRKASPYQGYFGPPWYGHVMVPIEFAFRDSSPYSQELPSEAESCIMRSPILFNESLRAIPERADLIQRDLNRSVWNGNLEQHLNHNKTNAAISKELLKEIRNTSIETKSVFEKSTADLQHTVLQSTLNNCGFLAGLAIDIMDRNLYERSNDCRWWALDTTFSELLETMPATPESTRKISSILSYINSLYTVYTNLIVFDRQARVIAVSQPAESERLVGTLLSEPWSKSVLLSMDSQTYSVSAFEKNHLYQDMPSYIYAAAIHGKNKQVVGGVALVFDSAPQFKAMLTDALPRDSQGEVLTGSFALFVDRERNVIACSDDTLAPGDRLEMEDDFFQVPNGASVSRIVCYQQHYYAIGCKMSNGYREYKQKGDCYQNDVLAMVFTCLNHIADKPRDTAMQSARIYSSGDALLYGNTMLVASFYVGISWFGLAGDHVVCAIAHSAITPSHHTHPAVAGFILHAGKTLWVVRLSLLVDLPEDKQSGKVEIVVVRFNDNTSVAIIVDQLGEAMDVENGAIQAVSALGLQHANMVDKVVVASAEQGVAPMLQIINPELLQAKVKSVIGSSNEVAFISLRSSP